MSAKLNLYSKKDIVAKLHSIENLGWIANNTRRTNDGAAGNILEDMLGVPENNLPIPNAAEWELKTQKDHTSSLITLFHQEPSPMAVKIVANMLLPFYGWKHKDAGIKYPKDEKSFRATLRVGNYTRGFTLRVDDIDKKVCVDFDSTQVKPEDEDWLRQIRANGDIEKLEVTPYWGIDDLFAKARGKLKNCFYVIAEMKREKRRTFFHFYRAYMLRDLDVNKFIDAIRDGDIYVDFDARTGHNHGTKFRIKPSVIPTIYGTTTLVMDKPKLNVE